MRAVIRAVAIFVFAFALVTTLAAQDSNAAIQQLYSEAKAAEGTGQIPIAIDKYRQILRLAPDSPAAHNNLGQLFYQQNRFEQAIPELQRACKLDPTLEPPRALLGFSYYQMRNFEQARDQLESASNLQPGDRTVTLFLARSLVELGSLQKAEHLLEELQKEEPKNPEVLYTLGSVYSGLAESAMSEIQSVSPNSYLIEVLLAKVAETKGIYSDAAEHYKKAIERAPQVSELYYQYGHAAWASKNYQEALPAYEHALQLNPYDYRASWEAGRVVLPFNPSEALRLVTNALKLEPDLPEALKIRGQALLALHKPQEAIENLKQSIELDPQDGSTHFQLARAYRQAGLISEAEREMAIFQKMQDDSHVSDNKN